MCIGRATRMHSSQATTTLCTCINVELVDPALLVRPSCLVADILHHGASSSNRRIRKCDDVVAIIIVRRVTFLRDDVSVILYQGPRKLRDGLLYCRFQILQWTVPVLAL
uniref:Uncharacterized protein n=1 Tax=Lygus hesperus TaxID=30085 RepID=A0A0A9YIQ4_LYGHE